MLQTKEIIVIGGGYSIKNAPQEALGSLLLTKCSIACNYACLNFKTTFTTFIDREFYYPSPDNVLNKSYPDISTKLKELSLIIGIDFQNYLTTNKLLIPNTLVVKGGEKFNREHSKDLGFFPLILTGLFSVYLAAWLLNYEGTLMLLGFDWTKRTKDTHYYDLQHRGVGKTNFYEVHNSYNYFKYLINEPKLKIYNVNLDSNIHCFQKITYQQMFTLLNSEIVNQDLLRLEIKQILN